MAGGDRAAGDRVVAVGLLTERDVAVLGAGFRRLFPLDGTGDFQSLLRAIDLAERRSMAERGATPG